MSKSLRARISKIPEDGADVAEIAYRAFANGKKGVNCRLVVRRTKPTPGSQLALFDAPMSSLNERVMSRAPDRFFVRLGCGPPGPMGFARAR